MYILGNQIKEYQKLKEKAAKESARYMAELDSKNREHKSVQDRLDTENRKKEEIEGKLKTKSHELEEAQKRYEKLVEHIKMSEGINSFNIKLTRKENNDIYVCF